MKNVYSSQSLKNAEKKYSGISLMEKAALRILSHITPKLHKKITIICGTGNNGGDGWAVASLAENHVAQVIYTGEPKTEESIFYKKRFNGKTLKASDEKCKAAILESELILDCIFGIGLDREPQGIYENIINLINESDAFVVSVDVPSGIPSDDTKIFPHVHADETICITSKKLSSVVTPTKSAYGKVSTYSIDVDMSEELPMATLCSDHILSYLPKRYDDSHKGTYGTLKTLCGSYNMTGAGILSIESASRCGVGLVKAFGEEKLLNIYKSRLSEPIYSQFSREGFIFSKATASLIGCGIGNVYDDDLREILTTLKEPFVLDADGINFLSRNIDICEHIQTNMILTPHPKEMSRLCQVPLEEVMENRFYLCKETAEKLGCTVVLKGNGTIICTPNHIPFINETGNSGLAKGGSGDILAGMIGSFLAQGVSPHYAAALAVYLHGLAADSLKEKYSEFSFLPSDIPLEVGRILADKLRYQ